MTLSTAKSIWQTVASSYFWRCEGKVDYKWKPHLLATIWNIFVVDLWTWKASGSCGQSCSSLLHERNKNLEQNSKRQIRNILSKILKHNVEIPENSECTDPLALGHDQIITSTGYWPYIILILINYNCELRDITPVMWNSYIFDPEKWTWTWLSFGSNCSSPNTIK